MPVPDLSGVPPWAQFDDLKNKINDIVAKYNNLLVNLDSLNVVSLTADHITSGTIDAGLVTIRADLTGGAYITLDTTNGLVINNGTFDTFKADVTGAVTMTSALIQTASGYPKVVMDPNTQLWGAYLDANDYIEVQADYGGSPSLNFFQGGALKGRINTLLGDLEIYGDNGIEINGNGLVQMFGTVVFENFSKIASNTPSTDLQTALDAKATVGNSTSAAGAGSFNGGIPIGTQLAVNGGGFVTWAGITIPNHSHTET